MTRTINNYLQTNMTQLQKTYEKYRDEFEKLEKYCDAFSVASNPFEYEQWAAIGSTYDRNGNSMISSEVPDSIKRDHRLYWEQRDKVNFLLKEDAAFQKLVSSKNYETCGNGLDAFFWISFYAIKHKIYPLS